VNHPFNQKNKQIFDVDTLQGEMRTQTICAKMQNVKRNNRVRDGYREKENDTRQEQGLIWTQSCLTALD